MSPSNATRALSECDFHWRSAVAFVVRKTSKNDRGRQQLKVSERLTIRGNPS
ncbi:MAG: hypothetical protein M3258_08445 [Thermoproteota archaeon]|nr:hypothetical protein [Thermoproteota archaeon]